MSADRYKQRRRCRLAGVTCAALLAVPAFAEASTVSDPGPDRTLFQAASGETNVVRSDSFNPIDDPSQRARYFHDSAGLTIGSGCQDGAGAFGANSVKCPPRGLLEIRLGDGNDSLSHLTNLSGELQAYGGTGADDLHIFASEFAGVHGEDGNDTIDAQPCGGGGLDGGDGNDDLTLRTCSDGPVSVAGGNGIDSLVVTTLNFAVSLDGVANDGALQTEARVSNVGSDVENVTLDSGNDQLIGSDGVNQLASGAGDDLVDGKGGADTIHAGDGRDIVNARDGVSDTVDCGDNIDDATVDPADTVTNCESIRIDRDGDGASTPEDCNDSNATIKPGAADTPGNGIDEDCSGSDSPVADHDGDGSTPPRDCNDNSAAIGPGAIEVPANGVDENCDGRDAARPVVDADVGAAWSRTPRWTKFTRLEIRGGPAGGRYELRCRGRGCPFKVKRGALKSGDAKLTKLLRGRKLRLGAVLELRVLAPGQVGLVKRYTVRRGAPKVGSLCLEPGSAPKRCS